MAIRGVRGAISIAEDSPDHIYAATRELLLAILQANPGLDQADVASVFFTLTPDLCSAFPALGARQLGWVEVPLLCAQEIAVPGSLERILRVLLHWNTARPQSEIQHVYLKDAVRLRPDLAQNNPAPRPEKDTDIAFTPR